MSALHWQKGPQLPPAFSVCVGPALQPTWPPVHHLPIDPCPASFSHLSALQFTRLLTLGPTIFTSTLLFTPSPVNPCVTCSSNHSSIRPTTYPSVHSPTCPFAHPQPSTHPSIYPTHPSPVYLFAHPPIHPLHHLSNQLPIHLSTYPVAHLPALLLVPSLKYLFTYLHLSTCPSITLSHLNINPSFRPPRPPPSIHFSTQQATHICHFCGALSLHPSTFSPLHPSAPTSLPDPAQHLALCTLPPTWLHLPL